MGLLLVYFIGLSFLCLYRCGRMFVLGAMFLFLCLVIMVILVEVGLLWYSLLFFMIYVGGLLILFFYLLSLHSNSLRYYSISLSLLSYFMCLCIYSVVILCRLDFYMLSLIIRCSYNLFVGYEFVFLFYIFSFLLLILYYIKIFTSSNSCPLRVLYK